MLIWSGNWLVARGLRDYFTPIGLNFWRWTLTLMILLPITWRELYRHRAVIARHWKMLFVLGGLSISLFNWLLYTALQSTTAVNGVLISSIQPVTIILIAWMVAGDRITMRQGLGTAVSLAGVLVIIARGDLTLVFQLQFNQGDLFALLGLPVWGLYSVFLRHRPKELSPMALLAAITVCGCLLMLPYYLYDQATGTPIVLNWQMILALTYLSLFSSWLGMLFYNTGVAALGPNVTGLFLHLIPVFVIGMAWAALGEAPRIYHLPGIIMIFLGIYLATFAGPSMPTPQSA